MDYNLKFAYFSLFYFFIPLLFIVAWYRRKYYKPIVYKYSLVSLLKKRGIQSSFFEKDFLFILRFGILLLLVFLLAKPQFVDLRSKVTLDGIDIMLALDVSGSMNCFDDIHERRSRIDIAKYEAVRFVKKRHDDAIGLVIFGKYAVSKCPLTSDKKIIQEIIEDLKIGDIDPSETVLSTGIVNAANRLKSSKAKSKIIILLTDGEPTPSDINPEIAIDIAKKMGIKIYTIGIGSQQGGLFEDPNYGLIACGSQLNEKLLQKIAEDTRGQYFFAKNSQDMTNIYDTIDKLEKTEYETNIYNRVYDFFIPIIFLIIFLCVLELVLTTFIWFGL